MVRCLRNLAQDGGPLHFGGYSDPGNSHSQGTQTKPCEFCVTGDVSTCTGTADTLRSVSGVSVLLEENRTPPKCGLYLWGPAGISGSRGCSGPFFLGPTASLLEEGALGRSCSYSWEASPHPLLLG